MRSKNNLRILDGLPFPREAGFDLQLVPRTNSAFTMATILERILYGYDRDSRRTWRRRALTTGEDYRYRYDGLSQVVSSNRGDLNLNCSAIAATPKHAESWDYDPAGNWRGYHVEADGAVILDQDRVHDKGNRLTQIKGEAKPFELDRVGRMIQATPNAAGDWHEPLKFTWDGWNRLKQVWQNGSLVAEYKYDGLNRRITKETGGIVRHSYYSDQWRPLEERKGSESTASAQYLWGARHRDDLVRRDRDSDGSGTLSESRYALMDYYSPAAIVDDAGEVTERYDFSAFGVRRILAPDFGSRSSSECAFEFAFQGQLLDTETGLLNYGYRYYFPHLGRWACKDPIELLDGFNVFAMTHNNPTNKVDYLGLQASGKKDGPPDCCNPCQAAADAGITPPDGAGANVCCCGKKYPCSWSQMDLPTPEPYQECIRMCQIAHEATHTSDPQVECVTWDGKPLGPDELRLAKTKPAARKGVETPAVDVEKTCLKACRDQNCHGDPACETEIDNRLDDLSDYLRQF